VTVLTLQCPQIHFRFKGGISLNLKSVLSQIAFQVQEGVSKLHALVQAHSLQKYCTLGSTDLRSNSGFASSNDCATNFLYRVPYTPLKRLQNTLSKPSLTYHLSSQFQIRRLHEMLHLQLEERAFKQSSTVMQFSFQFSTSVNHRSELLIEPLHRSGLERDSSRSIRVNLDDCLASYRFTTGLKS